ncbi:fungal-specific transcription factor domain-containing protein [Stachybotrys elegans]|uniref:Fungal-specific transcription factor domain-containing protein n=1 Tax=Stachybotrys elegans TaxID=80388 RepID=A0A8K0WTF2_9HYPO|nr:fungal-specific transcription factor domain-containing protein [Stachybotrys elegans]
MVHSASSCTDSWSSGGAERDDNENDAQWEQGSDDILAIPKLEPFEDEFNLDDLQVAPLTSSAPTDASSTGPVKQKRPRGRPRKHPLTPIVAASKVTKGRSKTGCITCRKRKKKCDEAKPRCMNCEKNAVVCEGYHEKQIWKSGKERAEEERMRRESLPIITMQPIFHGVETTEDKIFWKHYINHFSNVLTVEGEAKNAFKDIILHLANQHQGLMHSILAVSSQHIDFDAPYGAKLLQENPTTTREALQQRSDYHHEEALTRLYDDMDKSLDKDDPEYETVLSARYGQMLCLLLKTRAEGSARGEHRLHLQAYQKLIEHSPPQDQNFYTFITEFFRYHIYADDLFWYPETHTQRLSSENWKPDVPIHPPRLLGVADGLFQYLSQITTIRNTIRNNIASSTDPLVDYTSLYRAAEIDAAIREWTPRWPAGDSRERVGLLYKQMMWVYLFRTIYPPTGIPVPTRRSTFDSFPIPTAPPHMPQRRASMAGSISTPASGNVALGGDNPFLGAHTPHSCPPSRHPSRTNSMHEQDSRSIAGPRRSSPPPIRRPAHHDRRITLAVDESLAILESFKPSDPVQTLLLIPCLVIGTTCFEVGQQERIRAALRAVRGYTGLRNCDRVVELLEEVWSLMDKGQWLAVWDWQGVARRKGLDFLCT